MRSFDAGYIDAELSKIGVRLRKQARIFLIGGCAMSFRGLKESTKDVDIVFQSRKDYNAFCEALFGAQYFEPVAIHFEHELLEASRMFENKDGFHLDLFVNRVCRKLALSRGMASRAEFFKKVGLLEVFLVAPVDVFLFKSVASEGRTRDLSDMRVLYPLADWAVFKEELFSQEMSPDLVGLVVRRLEAFRLAYGLDVPVLKDLKKAADNLH